MENSNHGEQQPWRAATMENSNHGEVVFPHENGKEKDRKLIVKLKLCTSHENLYESPDLK